MAQLEFTSEELYEQAQGNVTAFILTTIAYFKESGQKPDEWITFVGDRFAPGWQSLEDQGAKAAMQALALNFLSGGAHLQSFSGDETRAEAVMIDWPPTDILEMLGLSQHDVDAFYEIFKPIATLLGLSYTWHREGNQVRFTFAR